MSTRENIHLIARASYKLFCLLNLASMVGNNIGSDEITHSVASIWVNILTFISYLELNFAPLYFLLFNDLK